MKATRSAALRLARRAAGVTLTATALLGSLTGAVGEPATPTAVAGAIQADVPPFVAGQNALAAVTPPKATTAPTPPTPGLVQAAHPLGAPPPLATPSSSYTFLQTAPDGSPIAYDPCRPIHYVTRSANAPAGGDQLIKEAIATISQATGLVFIDDGATDETPTPRSVPRPVFQPDRYGDRWAPVLIAWATSDEEPNFVTPRSRGSQSTMLALGGSQARGFSDSGYIYVSGQIKMSAAAAAWALDKGYGPDYIREILIHELGHVVGLGHFDGDNEVMNAHKEAEINDSLQSGDLAGLAILGQGKCRPGI